MSQCSCKGKTLTADLPESNFLLDIFPSISVRKRGSHCLSFEWQAPLSNIWGKICLGMKVEVPCRPEEVVGEDSEDLEERYWIATVVRIQGYMAMLRYVGMPDPEDDPSAQALGDFWMHLCSDEMKPVGWCAGQQKMLIPPPCEYSVKTCSVGVFKCFVSLLVTLHSRGEVVELFAKFFLMLPCRDSATCF
jgi:hypothetical protein